MDHSPFTGAPERAPASADPRLDDVRLGRFDHHPDPAIDFCIEVESLTARLINAKAGLSKPGTEPETIIVVAEAINRAMDFRVGGDLGAIGAKAELRKLYDEVSYLLPGAPFQSRVAAWMLTCFGAEISGDREERTHRFLEEALELAQANGCSREAALDLVDYAYGRPAGEPSQEVGGVMVTLAALCRASGIHMHDAAETELARVWTKVETIRAKQAAKPRFSALPGPSEAEREPLRFIYRNHRGEIAERAVRPLWVWFGSTEWHSEPQYLLRAIDLDKGAARDFAIDEIVGAAGSGKQLDAAGRNDG